MNERANPFAGLKDVAAFEPKPKVEKPVMPEALTEVAEANNFTSRQPAKAPKALSRKPRRHRTGRNVQFNAKLTAETNDRIYKLADAMSEEKGGPVALGELLRLALDALERERAVAKSEANDKMK